MDRTTLRRLIGTGLGCVALGVSAVTMAGPAGAADTAAARHRPRLTDEQKQCLADEGITRPIRPLTKEKVAALRAAAKACDLPTRPHRPRLTDEQKQCLADEGITRPIRPLTKEKVAALRAAAKACDIRRPGTAA